MSDLIGPQNHVYKVNNVRKIYPYDNVIINRDNVFQNDLHIVPSFSRVYEETLGIKRCFSSKYTKELGYDYARFQI